MKRKSTRRVRHLMLVGVLKWIPFVLMLFVVLFFETWLHTRTLRNGYESNRLNSAIRETRQQLSRLENDAAMLNSMERINAKAADLGLVEPKPNQIVRINVDKGPEDDLEEYALASLVTRE